MTLIVTLSRVTTLQYAPERFIFRHSLFSFPLALFCGLFYSLSLLLSSLISITLAFDHFDPVTRFNPFKHAYFLVFVLDFNSSNPSRCLLSNSSPSPWPWPPLRPPVPTWPVALRPSPGPASSTMSPAPARSATFLTVVEGVLLQSPQTLPAPIIKAQQLTLQVSSQASLVQPQSARRAMAKPRPLVLPPLQSLRSRPLVLPLPLLQSARSAMAKSKRRLVLLLPSRRSPTVKSKLLALPLHPPRPSRLSLRSATVSLKHPLQALRRLQQAPFLLWYLRSPTDKSRRQPAPRLLLVRSQSRHRPARQPL